MAQRRDSDTELVLATELGYEPNWLVASVDGPVERFIASGGEVVVEPFSIPFAGSPITGCPVCPLN